MKPVAPKAPDKNRVFRTFRQWHSWGGLLVSLLILVVAATGIVLNHKDLFLPGGKEKTRLSGQLTSTTDLRSLPVSFERALELARHRYGDVPLEKIELKEERGWLAYRVGPGQGEEIRIDAHSGEILSKYGLKSGTGATTVQWSKIVNDLHTGKIFGTGGKLMVDATSAAIIALTLTGIYLWGLPRLRKRQRANQRDANPRDRTRCAAPTGTEPLPKGS
ncbi:MAG: PepSY-associated TM helix domain-containing protein [Pirellulaceae bacterium]|nr:PepSY-associated TM helix domain-containing protein [Pirellulaceae bacterium]